MNKLSRREILLVAVTVTAMLGLVSWIVCSPALTDIRRYQTQGADLRAQSATLLATINRRAEWEKARDSLKGSLPRYKADVSVVAAVQDQVRKLADPSGLVIERATPKPNETQIGELSEIELQCDWSGSLDALTRFLYNVQTQGAMLDIRSLFIRPKQQQTQGGQLGGNFTIFYAFVREQAPPGVATNAIPAATQ